MNYHLNNSNHPPPGSGSSRLCFPCLLYYEAVIGIYEGYIVKALYPFKIYFADCLFVYIFNIYRFWVLAEGQITREIAIAQVILLHLSTFKVYVIVSFTV